jgi:hypothetical protein
MNWQSRAIGQETCASMRPQLLSEIPSTDTPLDLRAANDTRVRGVISVFSGKDTRERLRGERHTQIVTSVADVLRMLRQF